jgi:Protein of unknown function (DUF4013)
MRYWRAYSFVFDHPQWGKNLLLCAVCCLIPVVGPIVVMGWMFEVIDGFIRRGNESNWEMFEFGKFGQYLTRGVWPFLVGLILGLVVAPFFVVMAILWVVFVASSKGKPDPALMAVFIIGMVVVGLVMGILINLIKTPMILRAGLMQELGPAFSKAYTLDFVRKMWVQIIVAGLFLAVTSVPLAIAGELCCFFPLFIVIALITMAEHHLYYQLYMVYLQRGGMAIPLKEPRSGGAL